MAGIGVVRVELRSDGVYGALRQSKRWWRVSAPLEPVAVAHDIFGWNYSLVVKFRSVFNGRTVYEFLPAWTFYGKSAAFGQVLSFAGLEIDSSLRSEFALRRYLQAARPLLRVVIPAVAGGMMDEHAEDASRAIRRALGDNAGQLPDLEVAAHRVMRSQGL